MEHQITTLRLPFGECHTACGNRPAIRFYKRLGAGLRVKQAVVPFLTVKRGRVFTPDWGPRSWGWEPDRVLPAGPSGGCC